MRSILFLLLIGTFYGANAQLLDSISLFLQQPPVFVARLDMRGSFVRNTNVKIFGAKFGLEHAGRFQYGIGYSFLLTPVERSQFVEGEGEVITRLRMGYIDPYVEYVFYSRGPWEIAVQAQIGFGHGTLSYFDRDGTRRILQRSALFLYEPSMALQYGLHRYLALAGGWGFRLAMHTSSSLGGNLSAPIYSFGARVLFGEIWKDLRADRKKQ